jgi:RNA polymerase sigma-B factor
VVSASVPTHTTMENAGGKRHRGEKAADTTGLLHAYLERGDITARERLVELYLPLVESFAHRYERTEDYDDLFQAGCIGLINAIDRFDLTRGGELAAFAVPNIVGEIKRHLRDRTTSVRMPRPIQELRARAIRCETELSATLQRRPTSAEVARELGADREDVARALAARPVEGEQREASLVEGTQDALDLSDERLALASAFEVLDERERQIVYQRFVRDRSRSQVAQDLGISERHLSRQTHAALAKLREHLERAGSAAPLKGLGPAVASAHPDASRESRGQTPRQPFPKFSEPGARRGDRKLHGGRPGGSGERRDLPYTVSVMRHHGNADGNEWTAHVEELPGCEAHGRSAAEAVRRIEDAIEVWIDDAVAHGREIPDPRSAVSYSGRLMLRMPRSLHAELSSAAETEGVSLNQFITTSLDHALASPPAGANERAENGGGDGRPLPRILGRVPATGLSGPGLLRIAIVVNLIVVLVAGILAVVILIAGSQQGW